MILLNVYRQNINCQQSLNFQIHIVQNGFELGN